MMDSSNPLDVTNQESGIDLGFDVTEYLRGSLDMEDIFLNNATSEISSISQTLDENPEMISPQIPILLSPDSLISSSYASNPAFNTTVKVEEPPSDNSFYQLKSTPFTGSSSNFKNSQVRSRTQLKQELMREKLAEEDRKEQEARNKLQLQEERQTDAVICQPPIPNVDVPAKVFQVKTRLENPTKYYVKQSQERQVRQYLNQCIGGSVPQSPVTSPSIVGPAEQADGDNNLQPALKVQALSAPPNLLAAPSVSPNAQSPAPQSSAATSLNSAGSDADADADLVEEILSLEAGEPNRDLSTVLSNLKCDNDTKVNYTPENGSVLSVEALSPEDQARLAKDRQKKDNHNMIERRRRFNINDRIKELATLLPKSQSDLFYDQVGEFRPNKGTILKASVEYIKLLKLELEKLKTLEKRNSELDEQNKKLKSKIQDMERTAKINGLAVGEEELEWKTSPSPLYMKNELQIKKEPVTSPLTLSVHEFDELMDDDDDSHVLTGPDNPLLTQTLGSFDSISHPNLSESMDC